MIKNKKVKYHCAFVIIATVFLLAACGTTKNYQRLTVTGLHNTITRYKTTAKDIKKSYGKPYKTTKGISKVEKVYENINNKEGLNDNLSDLNYWSTIKESNNSDINPDAPYEVCYEYRRKELGVRSVYFFITDDKVMTYLFDGKITNKSIAKKDKYLRQIID